MTQQAGQTAIEGAQASRQLHREIEKLASELHDAAGVINTLEADNARIGTMLEVIRSIAEQTNLLALTPPSKQHALANRVADCRCR